MYALVSFIGLPIGIETALASMSVSHVKKAFAAMGPDRIIHVYGPTETTVFATFYPVNRIEDSAVSIPIGKPINETNAYILTENNRLQPIGAVGELCLSGTGVAKTVVSVGPYT